LRSTGVRTTTPSMVVAARRTSSMVTVTPGRLAHVHRLAKPPDAALAWAAEVVGSPVVDVKPLTGGMSTGIHLLACASGDRVVMRRFLNPHWLGIDPHLAPREAAVLLALEPTPVPAPPFVGVDPYGERCGAPTVLMGFVPGRRTVVTDHRRYAAELAHAMATIHDQPPPPVDGLPDERAELASSLDEAAPNRHGSTPTPAFWSIVRDCFASVTWKPNVLIHNDFHPGNVLFSRNRLSAIVDWPLAAASQPASDVCFCRLDAGMMLGLEVADLILDAYEAETGEPLEDRGWWDLFAASRAETDLVVWTESYAGLGPADLTVDVVRARFDEFVARSLRAAR
jgi:aminoglycoside phosphotransferase (APT) family kinase protein